MDGRQSLWLGFGEPGRNNGSPVATLRNITAVSKPLHKNIPRPRYPSDAPARSYGISCCHPKSGDRPLGLQKSRFTMCMLKIMKVCYSQYAEFAYYFFIG